MTYIIGNIKIIGLGLNPRLTRWRKVNCGRDGIVATQLLILASGIIIFISLNPENPLLDTETENDSTDMTNELC